METAPRVVVYTRRHCHLCEVAHQQLREHGIVPQLVDIDDDPILQERFGTSVPVVEVEGRVRFRGRIHPVLLRRLLRGG